MGNSPLWMTVHFQARRARFNTIFSLQFGLSNDWVCQANVNGVAGLRVSIEPAPAATYTAAQTAKRIANSFQVCSAALMLLYSS